MFQDLTAANVGSAVRWIITTFASTALGASIADGPTWTNLSLGAAALATVIWSFAANKKKVA